MSRSPAGKRVLLTGANGFLGTRTVEGLLARGCAVRAFVLSGSKVDHIRAPGVEIVFGDVAEPETLEPALEGVDFVIHAAADTSGTEEGGRRITIGGTRHLLGLAGKHRVEKLVYISSCSVYGVFDCQPNQLVNEDGPLERFPERRGPYSWAKFEAEGLVRTVMREGGGPIVCLRPGMIYGPGGDLFTPMIGFSLREKVLIVIGDGRMVLPLVHIDHVVEAILLAMESEKSGGRIYNVVDPYQIDKKTYMNAVVRRRYPRARVFYLPLSFLKGSILFQEGLFRAVRREPFLTGYRLTSSQKPVIFDASRIAEELGWRPQRSFPAITGAFFAGR